MCQFGGICGATVPTGSSKRAESSGSSGVSSGCVALGVSDSSGGSRVLVYGALGPCHPAIFKLYTATVRWFSGMKRGSIPMLSTVTPCW